MFERAVVINPGLADGNIDVGRLLDAMLYYQSIEVICDSRFLTGLWRRIGKDDTRALLSHPSLAVKITPEMPAIMNNRTNGVGEHSPLFISHAGRDGARIDPKDTVKILHQMISKTSDASLSDVKYVISAATDTRFNKLLGSSNLRMGMFESLIRDSVSMRLFLRSYADSKRFKVRMDLLERLEVSVFRGAKGYIISNNIMLNNIVPGGDLDDCWDKVLPHVQDYGIDLHLAQARSADILCSDKNSQVSAIRLDLSINRALDSDRQKSAFENFVFEDARPMGAAVNSGNITISQALRLIDETEKFRLWLNGLPPDSDIVKQYHIAVTKDTVLNKLPSKLCRFSFFTGTGVIADLLGTGGLGTAAGVALSAVDSFVIDGLVKGWRPNIFVDTVRRGLEERQ